MKKAGKDKQRANKTSVASGKYRLVPVFGMVASLIISIGTAAYATDAVAKKSKSATIRLNSTSTVQTKTASTAKKTVLRAQTIMNQVPSNLAPGAEAASNRYEALEQGHPLPGTSQTDLLMYGYVPSGMSPQQAQMLYNSLPNNLRKRTIWPQPGSPEWVARMAHEPVDPSNSALNSVGMSRSQIEATNQKLIRESIRERFGPIYIPPLHKDHNVPTPATTQKNQTVRHSYTKDYLGSIREMTDSSGNIVSQYSYDPYGRQTKVGGTGPDADFGFEGYYVHQRSGLNLTLMRAYSPKLGRFLNHDPIEEAGGVNLYAYAGNDPINRFDPTGTLPVEYRNWGGPGWTNGRNQIELSNFPYRPGQNGFRKPANPRDRCYYWHDVCLHNCARIGSKDPKKDCPKDRQRCRRNCDQALADCLQNVLDTYGQFQFGLPPLTPGEISSFTPPGSWNDNPGQFVPGLQPYENIDPGVISPGMPQ